jgi:hypothetical protein
MGSQREASVASDWKHDRVFGHLERVVEESERADSGDVSLGHLLSDQPLGQSAFAHVAVL